MLTITNPKAIKTILGMDAKMERCLYLTDSVQYDFLNESILLRDTEGLIIGNYNLLPERLKVLQEYINGK